MMIRHFYEIRVLVDGIGELICCSDPVDEARARLLWTIYRNHFSPSRGYRVQCVQYTATGECVDWLVSGGEAA